ncbi:hypothetical protein [Frankia sp. AgB32]|uniref:hypothetical protein n=1 Tax=Frankia sp. AgB32 TaxID=631119 RepID=UPI00200E3ECC|nr:hypothetical protein [Frankia sp. AgB32]MCK9894695.1 hypothetical protein [Frankia sp. AgB32]
MFILAQFTGDPIFSLTAPRRADRQHLQGGGQVTYTGSLVELRGPAAVVGQCACAVCMPSDERMAALGAAGIVDDDYPELFGRFRLYLRTAGGVSVRCVRPESVEARSVRWRVVETGWTGGISWGWEVRDYGPSGVGGAFTVADSYPGSRAGRDAALAVCAERNRAAPAGA